MSVPCNVSNSVYFHLHRLQILDMTWHTLCNQIANLVVCCTVSWRMVTKNQLTTLFPSPRRSLLLLPCIPACNGGNGIPCCQWHGMVSKAFIPMRHGCVITTRTVYASNYLSSKVTRKCASTWTNRIGCLQGLTRDLAGDLAKDLPGTWWVTLQEISLWMYKKNNPSQRKKKNWQGQTVTYQTSVPSSDKSKHDMPQAQSQNQYPPIWHQPLPYPHGNRSHGHNPQHLCRTCTTQMMPQSTPPFLGSRCLHLASDTCPHHIQDTRTHIWTPLPDLYQNQQEEIQGFWGSSQWQEQNCQSSSPIWVCRMAMLEPETETKTWQQLKQPTQSIQIVPIESIWSPIRVCWMATSESETKIETEQATQTINPNRAKCQSNQSGLQFGFAIWQCPNQKQK